MNRRSFLTFLGLAPIAAPAAVAAVGKPAAVRFVGASTPYLSAGRRILIADEVDLYPGVLSPEDSLKLNDLSRLTYADMYPERIAAKLSMPGPAAVHCPAFIDDAGGGP